jgi:hypothetical protein
MREHGEERRIGQVQRDLHGARVRGLDGLDDAGRAAEKPRHDRVGRRGMGRAGEEYALEARRDVRGREESAVVEADPVAEPK